MPMPQKPASNSLFSKGSTAEVGAVQVQKWTTGDKPRLAGAVVDQLGKNYTNNSLLRELNSLPLTGRSCSPSGLEWSNRDGRLTAGKELLRP
jgi:hypothetical protein